MKFTDGYWKAREGVTAHYATSTADHTTQDQRITLYAPVHTVRHRGDTLNSPLLTVECWSPAEDIIGVKITHHAGHPDPGPHFALTTTPDNPAKTTRDGTLLELTTGGLTLRTDTAGPWNLEFRTADRTLTTIGERSLGFATDADGHHHMIAKHALGIGELVYGLGERFTPLTRNGQTIDIWQADGGTSSEQAYKNIPFHLTNRGYGVFVDHPAHVSYEIGSEAVSRLQFSVEDQTLQFFVINGPTPKDVLTRYTALTGRPALPPAWSFGLWLSTSFTTDYDEATVARFVQGMTDRDIPLSVFHFDCFWMRAYQWTDFHWDPDVFPDPQGMLTRLKEQGLRICVWINPYIAQKSALFAEGAHHGYLVKRTDGSIWQWDQWQAGMALVDFTNPDARTWYADKLRGLLDQGVDCFKTDFGERIPTDVTWHDGSDPARMHNYYTQLYNQTVFDVLTTERPGDAVLFARSATAGGQSFPVHWGGDCESTFSAMAESLRGGLSLGLSGFGFWSHDIGGFEGTPTPALFARWAQFGLLSSHSRLHGSHSYRVPWQYDETAVTVTRDYTRLKHRLMPYLFHAALQAHTHGIPVLRAMLLEFPDDPACHHLDRQYMLGDDLLVAPVLSEDGHVDYYLPAGEWTHLLTGERLTGPGWRHEHHPTTSLPLLARPGSVIPFGAHDDQPQYDWADGVTLRVHTPADGTDTTTAVPAPDGTTAAVFRTRRTGDTLTIEAQAPAPTTWHVLLVGATDPHTTEGATAQPTPATPQQPAGLLLTAAPGTTTITTRRTT